MFRIVGSGKQLPQACPGQLGGCHLEFTRKKISVAVEDDGVGFDPVQIQGKLNSGKHFGLLNMQSRANVLGGSLQFHGEPGKGAKVFVTIPLVNGEGGPLK